MCAALAALSGVQAARVDVSKLTEENMFPFVPSYDAPKNVVDMSHLLEAPAGKSGRIRVKDGHFVNDRGRVRLNATNLTGPSNFPTHEEAERLAARLARFGINCVRLHYFDSEYGTFMLPAQQGIIADDYRTKRRLDPKQLDRMDYMIAQFKKRGIYVNINLHVARTLDARDGFAPGTPWANKGVDQFDPRIIAEEKAYAKDLLSHVNPYTGMSYLKDPVVAMVELNNEDALWNQYLGGGIDNIGQPYATVFKNLWNDWLGRKYGTTKKLLAAWKVVDVPLGEEQIAEGAFNGAVAIDNKTWILDRGTSKVSVAAKDGALRVDVTQKGGEYFPKVYRRVALRRDVPYTVSFRIRRVSGASGEVGFAVADRSRGWESLGVLTRFTPGTKWTKKSFAFFSAGDIKTAEIQFTRFGAGGVYEIDDLSFKTGAEFPKMDGLSLEKGEFPIVKSRSVAPMQMQRDFYQFLVDTERAYWTGMQKYLQRDLGLEAPVSATQLGYSPPHVQADLDFVDNHAYWCHPSIGKKWAIDNLPMVATGGGCMAGLSSVRVAGKPYTVSEYNHPYPLFYGAEGQPMLRAYGAFQGWDGVFEYSYNNRQNAEPINNEYFFSLAARTDVLAHFPACAAIYLRGDVRESERKIVANLPYSDYFDQLCKARSLSQGIAHTKSALPHALGLVHGVAVDVTGKTADAPAPGTYKLPQGPLVSDTKELTWSTERDGSHWTVNTANTKLFTGFPKDRTFDLGGVKLAIGETKLGWATISLVSQHATGFGEQGRPTRVLLTATGLCHNGGAKFTAHGGDSISCRDADWGTGKTVCEGIPATVTLPSPAAKTVCRALDERGEPKATLPVTADANGCAVVKIDPSYKTIWYEIEVK